MSAQAKSTPTVASTTSTRRRRSGFSRRRRWETRPVYDLSESAIYDADHRVQELFDRLARERDRVAYFSGNPANSVTVAHILDELAPQFKDQLSRAQLRSLLTLPPTLFQHLRDFTTEQVARSMDRDLRDKSDLERQSSDVQDAAQDIANAARATLRSPERAAIVRAVASRALRPNHLLNVSRTQSARDQAVRSVRPVYEHITRGDKILGVGETVTRAHLDRFVALGLLDPHLDLTTGAAICVLAAVMVLLVVYTIAHNLPKLYADRRKLALLSLIVLVSVLGLKVGAAALGMTYGVGQPGYLGMMSVVAAAMLISVLIDRQLAFLVAALLSVQSGLIMNHEIRFTVMTLLSSIVGIASASPVRSRSNLLVSTGALAVANVALVWLMGLLLRDSLPELLNGSVWAVGSAAFASFLFWLGILTLEKPFRILTHATLLEMSDGDRALLKSLCMIAPGTYAHSILVGTLAEAGARAVGADALLCKVGGYYHDIGKMTNPEFFVENQRRENVHGRLSPSLSALIITGHVRNGIETANQHKLPKEICDIIAQHHGTTLIAYFYHRALADCGGDPAPDLEQRFRYPGPKPQTREAAIVMLADSVEAATRCLDAPTPERLEAEIDKIVKGKIEDQQFDECSLTFRDVRGICQAFLHVLSAMMHGRIRYPQLPPRTATGLPMEVSRPDLRPDDGSLPLPALPSGRPDDVPIPGTALAIEENRPGSRPLADSLPTASDPALFASIMEASGARDGYGAVGAIGYEGEDAPASPANVDSGLDGLRVVPLANCSPVSIDPEMLHAHSDTQRTNTASPNGPPFESGPDTASGRRTGPRRGKRSPR